MNYLEIIKQRRSIYDLSNDIQTSRKEITELIEKIIEESPTAFNMQSSRIIILFGKEHEKLWNITTEVLRKKVSQNKLKDTMEKMNKFKKCYGTILFFEDEEVVSQYKEQFKTYAVSFDMFASHGLGILQGNVWNALAANKIGANLQHYNPIIDEQVKETWNIPEKWKLVSQMVFGNIVKFPEAREKIPGEKRVQVFE